MLNLYDFDIATSRDPATFVSNAKETPLCAIVTYVSPGGLPISDPEMFVGLVLIYFLTKPLNLSV